MAITCQNRAREDCRLRRTKRTFNGIRIALARSRPSVESLYGRIAPIDSLANAEASASVSCAERERLRTERPKAMSGKTMKGMAISTRAERRGLVINHHRRAAETGE